MGYVEQQLMPGEVVVFRTKLHPIVFVRPLFFAFLLLIVALILILGETSTGGGVAIIVVAALLVAGPALRRATSEFAVTNKRVIVKLGIVSRYTLELLLQKIETIAVHQSVGGRMFGYGTITVRGTGGTPEVFPRIADPLGLRQAVNQQLVDGPGSR